MFEVEFLITARGITRFAWGYSLLDAIQNSGYSMNDIHVLSVEYID